MKFFKVNKNTIAIRLIIILSLLNLLFFIVGLIKNTLGLGNLYINFFFFFLILMTAYSPAYSLTIDTENRNMQIKYRFLYFIEKQRTLTFEQFDYRYNYGTPFLSLGGYEVNIYFYKNSIATLNTKFGWKKKVLKEIIEILEEIKLPKPRVLDKKTISK